MDGSLEARVITLSPEVAALLSLDTHSGPTLLVQPASAAADGVAHLVEERNALREQIIGLAANVEAVKRELREESAELDQIAELFAQALGRRTGTSLAGQVRAVLAVRDGAVKLARHLLDDTSSIALPDQVLEVATDVLHHAAAAS